MKATSVDTTGYDAVHSSARSVMDLVTEGQGRRPVGTLLIWLLVCRCAGARGGTVGGGTELQAGRSRVPSSMV